MTSLNIWDTVIGNVTLPGFTVDLAAGTNAVTATPLVVDIGTKTAAATAGAATLAKYSGVITSEALTTAAGATYTLTITNSLVAATSICFASVAYGTATAGAPAVVRVQPGASSLVVTVQNIHASAALDGTIKIAFLVLPAA